MTEKQNGDKEKTLLGGAVIGGEQGCRGSMVDELFHTFKDDFCNINAPKKKFQGIIQTRGIGYRDRKADTFTGCPRLS